METAVATLSHTLAVEPARRERPTIIPRKIIARMIPYSTAVAARSSRINFAIRFIIRISGGNTPNLGTHNLGVVNGFLARPYFLETIPTIAVVAAALVDGEGRVLLQQRPAGRAMAGLWEFPGGKVEPGERPEAALIRELHEELGIGTDAACLAPATFASADLDGRHLLLLLYICRKWRGQPAPLHASGLQWVRPHQMFGLPMPPADRPLIGLLDALI